MAETSFSLNVRPINSQLQKLAEIQLNEVPSRLQEDLDHIKKWLSKQPHIISRTDDQWILNFLRSSKFSLENAKVRLEVFYLARPILQEVFSNRDPFQPEIQEVLKLGIFMVLPKAADPTAPRIIMIRTGLADPDKIALVNMAKVLSMLLEILFIEDDNYVIAGHSVVIDLHNFAYKYATQFTPSFIKKILIAVRDIHPSRIKSLNYINTPQFCMAIYNAFKLFLTEENMARSHFYNQANMEDLYQFAPLSTLPNEYGGTAGSCDELAAQMKTKIEDYRQWFIEDCLYYVDETKRPKDSKAPRNYDFGLEGSFRNLNTD